jgi:CHAT domain
MRIEIRFDLADPAIAKLALLPWELLYDPGRRLFLARGDRHLLIVRFLDLLQPTVVSALQPPLRILIAAPSPAGLPALCSQLESELISRSARGAGFEIEQLEEPTLDGLRNKLLLSRFDVLHFIGHGEFVEGEGMLLLGPTGGVPQIVKADLFASHIAGTRLRLVVLNACDTARLASGAGVDPFAGLAAALMRNGVAAVVAMQFPISDTAAVAFSASLYSRLAAGDRLDTAVTEARLAIHRENENSLEWATPVEYARADPFPTLVTPPPVRAEPGWLAARGWWAALLCFGVQALAWNLLGWLVLVVVKGTPELTSLVLRGTVTAVTIALAVRADRALPMPRLRRGCIYLAAFLAGLTPVAILYQIVAEL